MKILPSGNFALSISRAGNELRINRFIEIAKPRTFIMTDGAGKNVESRMQNSIQCIDKSVHNDGALKNELKEGNITNEDMKRVLFFSINHSQYEVELITDSHIYNELISDKLGFFVKYVEFLANHFIHFKIDYVVCESSEGFNPVNEMCRIVTNIAIEAVKKATGKIIHNYDFPIYDNPNQHIDEDSIHIVLDDSAFERKISAIANHHSSILSELKPIVGEEITEQLKLVAHDKALVFDILKTADKDIIMNEYLQPFKISNRNEQNPFYESHGEKIVESGIYSEIITYEKHILPMKKKLESAFLQ